MITVKSYGGLGNQMFQYAVGRRLSIQLQTGLQIYFEPTVAGGSARDYSLDCFELFPGLKVYNPKRIAGKLHRTILNLVGTSAKFVNEKTFNFDPNLLKLPDDIILDGYWQSEKYFLDVAGDIKKDFKFKNSLEGRNLQTAVEISSSNSISLHIRRGDYISVRKTNDYHGICGLDYYRSAIRYLKKPVLNPKYFIFSDDIEWAKKNLKLNNKTTFIDWNIGDNSYKDMQLMSLCRHNIVANSSFSWWGAWLNTNPDKIVVAPNRWFADPKIKTTDLLPPQWIKL